MDFTIKKAADISGVTVRTLRYYHQIGILIPESINNSLYRLYNDADIEALQQILFYKELGFSLDEIKALKTRCAFDDIDILNKQKTLLSEKIKRLENIMTLLDKAINDLKGDSKVTQKKKSKSFDRSEIDKHQAKYAEEVRKKYQSEIVDESLKKAANYNDNKWGNIIGRQDEINTKLADCLRMGLSPHDDKVIHLIKEFQTFITDNFYKCTDEILFGLGEMYVSDQRFTDYYEKYETNFAEYINKGIKAYCAFNKES